MKLFVLGMCILFFASRPCYAGTIYYYRDASGVLHVTNVAPQTVNTPRITSSYKKRRFPQALKRIVWDAARRTGLDPFLLMALVKIESGGDPSARSPKGAMGLTQLMPSTARALGVIDPYDPRENLIAGATYLRDLLDQFNGDIILALSAYNAGPGAVEAWKDIPDYTETKAYVKKVLDTWKALSMHND